MHIFGQESSLVLSDVPVLDLLQILGFEGCFPELERVTGEKEDRSGSGGEKQSEVEFWLEKD